MFTEDYCMCDSEYFEYISLRELQLSFFHFFSSQNFPMLTFPLLRLMYHGIFFNSINLSFTRDFSIQLSSYSVIHNVMLFDFALTIKTRTIVPSFRTDRISICINLTIVVVFIHYIHYIAFFKHL